MQASDDDPHNVLAAAPKLPLRGDYGTDWFIEVPFDPGFWTTPGNRMIAETLRRFGACLTDAELWPSDPTTRLGSYGQDWVVFDLAAGTRTGRDSDGNPVFVPPPAGMALVEVWGETGQHDAFVVKPVGNLADGVALVEVSPAAAYGSDWVIATRDSGHWVGLSYDQAWPLTVQLPRVHK